MAAAQHFTVDGDDLSGDMQSKLTLIAFEVYTTVCDRSRLS